MNGDCVQNRVFILRDIKYSEQARFILIEFDGQSYKVNLKKLTKDPDLPFWMISGSDICNAFGESYFQGLGAFIGRLAEKCHLMNVSLPLRPISIDDVRIVLEENMDQLNEIVDLAIVGANLARLD